MSHIPVSLYDKEHINLWFGGDQPRLVESLKDRTNGWHYRSTVHPLYSLLVFPFAAILQSFGLSHCKPGSR